MGNCVPCVAVSVDDYYRHKNGGALGLFELEDYLLHDEAIFGSQAETTLDRAASDHARVAGIIKQKLTHYIQEESTALEAGFLANSY